MDYLNDFKFESMFESGNGKYRHNGVEISKPTDKSNYFLIGVESTHNNGKEDRKFQVFYAMSTKYRLEGCTWLIQSQYYETMQFPSSGLQTTWGKKNFKILIREKISVHY